MLNFFKKNIYILLLIVFSAVVYHLWFFTFAIIKNGDWGYYYKDTMATQNIHWFSVWLGETFGRVVFELGQAPVYVLYGYFTKYLNFDFVVNERILYLWPVALLPSLLTYWLLRILSFNKVASFIGAIVYAYNTYFLVLQTGHMTLMGAFAIAPVVILMYIRSLNTLSLPRTLFTGLLLSLEFAYEPRSAYLTVWILLLFAIYSMFFVQRKMKIILKYFIFTILPLLVLGLLNIYWIFALFATQAQPIGVVIGRPLFGNEFYNIFYSITLFHPFWTGSAIAAFKPQPIPPHFWFIPIFAFLGLILNRKNKYVLFFGVIALLGIFLSKQVAHPFQDVYSWLYSHLPGFNAFREASKFYYFVVVGYTVMIAAFVDWLWKNWVKGRLYIYGRYFLTFVIAAIFLWNTKTLITGEYVTLFVAREINRDYLVINNLISRQSNFFRIFCVPSCSQYSYNSYTHPVADWSSFARVSKQNVGDEQVNKNLKPGEILINWLNKPYADNVLNLSSVKYVFIPVSDDKNDDNVFLYLEKKREYYIKQLDILPYLTRIDIGTENIIAYENKDYRPHIYTTREKETIYKNIPFKQVTYDSINPTRYHVYLKNVKDPLYINFVETYHSDWKIRIGDFHWYDVILNKDYFLPDSIHKENDAGFNSFYLDVNQYCKNKNICTVNVDGTTNIKLTLFFKPQAYLYLGKIFSVTILLVIVIFLLARLFLRYGKN